jgi:hypothetical protein
MPNSINKLLALFFLLGAIGAFGLSQRTSYQVQDHSYYGTPVGEPRTVYIRAGDRVYYMLVGVACMAGSLYFVAKVRRNDTNR